MAGRRDKARYCPRCKDLQLVETTAAHGVAVDSCTRCAGVWYDAGELAAMFPWIRRANETGGTVESLDVSTGGMPCPVCVSRTLQERTDGEDVDVVFHECNHCGGTWLGKETWGKFYRKKRQLDAPVVRAKLRSASPLSFSRASFDNPWVEAGGPPVVLIVAAVLVLTGFDKLLVFARIMFHEIGHAVPAWFSGRAALPLPFGITFVREDQSWWTTLCLAFLIGVFGYRSFRERRKVAMAFAVLMFGFMLFFTYYVMPFRSLMCVGIGGLAGEFIVPTIAMLLYHYPMPDRLRWDFWRFFIYVPAMVTFVGAFHDWIYISNKVAAMPSMSMFGVPGDGQSDIEKLIGRFGWSADQIGAAMVGIGILCGIILVVNYGYTLAKVLFFDDE
ncbi:MAG: zf-TFIIB domain-containing protein [Myxococcales bacterium]|nr:zf-TFIIB domain-containing protein [Myxococcales bacterium]